MCVIDMKDARHKFDMQVWHAKCRGIDFLISFEDWLDLWISSGHWEQRGRNKGQYCMSRVGDIGPYQVGNVFIQSNSQNSKDVWTGRKHSNEAKAKMKQTLATPETKAKMTGDGHYRAKLTKEQVDIIFNSPLKQRELAEIYSISQAMISRIKNRKHYHQ